MSDKSKVLVLGAGAVQLPLIKELRVLGFYVLAVSNIEEDKASAEVDEFHLISSANFPKIRELIEQEGVINAFSIGSDVAMRTLTKLAAHFSWVNHPTVELFEFLHNKKQVREALCEVGLSKIECKSSIEYSEGLFDFAHNEKWIIKPIDGYGSKGIYQVEEYHDKEKYFKLAKMHSVEHQVVVEPFIEGEQFTSEFFVTEEGQVIFLMVAEKMNNEAFVPYLYLLKSYSDFDKFINRVSAALNLGKGFYNIDFVHGAAGFELMDVAPRMGGNHLAVLYETAFEKNSIEDYVSFILDGTNLEKRKPAFFVGMYLLHHPKGGLVTTINEQIDFVNVLAKEYWLAVGDEIPAFTQGSSQQGYLIFESNKKQSIDELDELFTENEIIKTKSSALSVG
jgi:predicted ATP-grasp superfamily ATP-dependent carboligase